MFKSEAENIKPTNLQVDGKDTYHIVKNQNPQNNDLSMKFYISSAWSRTDGRGRGVLKRFKDYIPSNLIKKRADQYKINLGKFPIKNEYFKRRWLVGHYSIKLNLTIEREFDPYATKIWTFKIKKKSKKGDSIKKENLEI